MNGRRHGWRGRAAVTAICLCAALSEGVVRATAYPFLVDDADADGDIAGGAERRGGATTVFDDGPNAFGRALANLEPFRWREFRSGKERFLREWPARGPWADAASCADCHFRDGRGPRPDPAHSRLSHLLRLGRPSGGADPVYGAQLRRSGYGVPAPGRLTVEWDETRGQYPSGARYLLRQPRVRVTALAYGPLDPGTRLSLRVPPAVFGLGLIEAVPEHEIRALADPEDSDANGISGRPQQVRDLSTGGLLLGRFGWKVARHPVRDGAPAGSRRHEPAGVDAGRA